MVSSRGSYVKGTLRTYQNSTDCVVLMNPNFQSLPASRLSGVDAHSLQQSLSSQVLIRSLVEDVSFGVLELFIIGSSILLRCRQVAIFVCQLEDIIDLGHHIVVARILDAQHFQIVGMPCLCKMSLKVPRSPVGYVSTDLAPKLVVEPVQLVQPVRNRLTIPSQRHVFRVVNRLLLTGVASVFVIVRNHRVFLGIPFLLEFFK
mmetsp:Transcript_9405/g.13723  ORF Transcript_9405/g.13723 Transcript_9405/m.13723 type:complete len:203 (+) Transcript_9405:212-820(+)